jgi:hypothetical protein
MNLKEAITKNKLKQFVEEREGEPSADKERFDVTLSLKKAPFRELFAID